MSTPASAKPRPRPHQDRSLRTAERVLDAARSLLTRLPYAQINTRGIAAEAGLSVGALYRFFPDRQSILGGVAADHRRQLNALVNDEIATLLSDMWQRGTFDAALVLGTTVDLYLSYLDAHPDYRALCFGRDFREVMTRPGRLGRNGLAAILITVALWRMQIPESPEFDRMLGVGSEAGERLIAFAYEQPTREQRDRVIAELKKMLSAYLGPALAVPKGSRKG